MATSFFGGSFFGGEFFNQGGPQPEVPRPPRPDDGPGKRRVLGIVKPTGLGPRRKKVEQAFVTERDFGSVEIRPPEPPPIVTMSQAEIDMEIGLILRKKVRTEGDEIILLLLMAAAAAIN